MVTACIRSCVGVCVCVRESVIDYYVHSIACYVPYTVSLWHCFDVSENFVCTKSQMLVSHSLIHSSFWAAKAAVQIKHAWLLLIFLHKLNLLCVCALCILYIHIYVYEVRQKQRKNAKMKIKIVWQVFTALKFQYPCSFWEMKWTRLVLENSESLMCVCVSFHRTIALHCVCECISRQTATIYRCHVYPSIKTLNCVGRQCLRTVWFSLNPVCVFVFKLPYKVSRAKIT